MHPFSLLIKPASADCNLRCTYCFYLDRCELYPSTAKHRMSPTTLDKMVSSFMAVEQPEYSFAWQGGEPTLMGLGFFREAIALQKSFLKPNKKVVNGLQTNGTLINDEWARFFRDNDFLLGVSLDGPQQIHDTYRCNRTGSGSYDLVIAGIDKLRQHRVDFNILTLVSQANVHKPLEVYRFLRDELNCYFHQYIECVEFDLSGNLLPFATNDRDWGDFLCAIFDEWVKNDTRRVSVRLFDSILSQLVTGVPTVCTAVTDCRQYLVVEHNGDVYPCDFFVEKEKILGNIFDSSWQEMQTSNKYEEFGSCKRDWHAECETCALLQFCAGDCQRNRPGMGTIPGAKSILCDGWKQFLNHSLPRFKKLAEEIVRESRPAKGSMPDARPSKVGRNDPCPCGSGDKYKKCCQNKHIS